MLSALRGRADARQHHAELDRWSSAGEVPRLEELGHALLAEPGVPAFGSVFERVERLLALTPSAERAAAVVRLAEGLAPRRVRWTVTLLATGQPASVLLPLPAELRALELGACLLHEMVLRGMSVAPVAATWRSRLTGHPLGVLPLEPLPGEAGLPLPGRPAAPGAGRTRSWSRRPGWCPAPSAGRRRGTVRRGRGRRGLRPGTLWRRGGR